jgi:hypothetical protein
MPNAKTCPLQYHQKAPIMCTRGNCAWWDHEHEQCCKLTQAMALDTICEAVNNGYIPVRALTLQDIGREDR